MNEVMVIKRSQKRKAEAFSRDKLVSSIASACYSVRLPEGAGDDIANRVAHEVELWLVNKGEVTADDIRREASKTLLTLCPEAGYLYQQNKSII